MAKFLEAFNLVYGKANPQTNETVTECITNIPDDKFHFWFLLPSSAMILLLAFSFHRKNLYLSCLGGRPAAVFPMDILGKSNRMSYAAAWGAITFLTVDMVFGLTVIVDLQGPRYVTIWNKILSMGVIGVGYFPMFAALALDSLVSLVVAELYACVLFAVNTYKIFECDLIPTARLILFARDFPNLVCLGYLCISIPLKMFKGLRRKTVRIYTSKERVSVLKMDKDLDLTSEAEHVRNLLRPPKPPRSPPANLQAKVVGIAKSVTEVVVYQNKNKYRYSTRILTVTLMGLMLLYKVAVELFVMILAVFNLVDKGIKATIDIIGKDSTPGEEKWMTYIRDTVLYLPELITNLRICFIVSLTLILAAGILTILHMMTSYRTNLLSLYRGDNTHIPHRSTLENTSLLLGSMRYAGYQVAYIGWGFVLHFICISIACVALDLLIILLALGITQWLLWILETIWPALMMTIIPMLVQTLSAKFFFLQGRGRFLAMNNRRALFSFSFFMFFYNIFLGFLSCLLRIIKSVVIGVIFLPRLDNSALTRRFQMMDPGFAAYAGFLHVECSHTHPVLLIFVRILLAGKKKRDEPYIDPEKSDITIERTRAFVRARIRWQTAYSILKNPALRALRKSHLDHVKELQERLSKLYYLDKNQTSELIKEIQKSGVDLKDVNVTLEAEGKRTFSQHWDTALKINNMMQKMRRDRGLGLGIFASQHRQEGRSGIENLSHANDVSVESNDNVSYRTKWKVAAFTALKTKFEETDTVL
ncbi:stimulated by retinoic acid gene 6 protein-like isoform X3 [Dreissena polymorpha]|uniref:Receptor for retinol uptake STRA6 n=3 Tax=Dreissena polymorpha TaxID=45954 RepID=A0A9D4JF66_DREPO|nr:stimulated by retinoic acid gene 6 protein-like isoform X3 [Dreissena polymorpha]XP_052217699.1 stimulated by retinoic acid gene 6 protein-like isoform X3 [Dreissena polymorpha]XP_052217700.1 stimulated by retinoic acid gene 6 protein-like isoform X3 [Dreissena polymorpha]KAH3809600.1 hypothetical protein DPMN_137974 [Dreissena polymorpha]